MNEEDLALAAEAIEDDSEEETTTEPEQTHTRYYDPETGSEALEGIHDISRATAFEDMPATSQAWFSPDPIPEGKQWVTDATGKYPVLEDIPPPTSKEKRETERNWSKSELALTDVIMLSDSPYTEEQREQVKIYRAATRNPFREATVGYPDQSWRPEWPSDVKRPGE